MESFDLVEALDVLGREDAGASEVVLAKVSLSEADMHLLAQALVTHAVRIKQVSLFFCKLNERGFHVLCEALGECANLERIDLFNTLLPDALLEDLFQVGLANKRKLVGVNLHANGLGDKSCITLARQIAQWPELASLDLSNNEVSHLGANALCDALASGRSPGLIQLVLEDNPVPDNLRAKMQALCYAAALRLVDKQTKQISRLQQRNVELERRCNALLVKQFSSLGREEAFTPPPPPPPPPAAATNEEFEPFWTGHKPASKKADSPQTRLLDEEWYGKDAAQRKADEFSNFVQNREADIALQQQQQHRAVLSEEKKRNPVLASPPRQLESTPIAPFRVTPPQQQQGGSMGKETFRFDEPATSTSRRLSVSSSPSKRAAESSGGAPREASPRSVLTPGQWRCNECFYVNPSSRRECFSCLSSRALASSSSSAAAASPETNAWSCLKCTYVNHKNFHICEMCNAARNPRSQQHYVGQ